MTQPAKSTDDVKALCMRVLERNRGRNYRATKGRETVQLLPLENTPKVAQEKAQLRNDPPASCSSCLYFRFNRLAWWCCHPNHNRRITGMGCKGEDHVDRFTKPLPGHAPSWPPPVPPEKRIKPP